MICSDQKVSYPPFNDLELQAGIKEDKGLSLLNINRACGNEFLKGKGTVGGFG